MEKDKMIKAPADHVGLRKGKQQDVKCLENLKELQKALPECPDLTNALRYLCKVVAPRETERLKKLFAKAG